MDFQNSDRIIRELLMSPTMDRVAQLAAHGAHSLDMTNPRDRKRALATTSVGVIQALDAERIHVRDPRDLALLHGLLMAAMEVIHDGRFGSDAVRLGEVQ